MIGQQAGAEPYTTWESIEKKLPDGEDSLFHLLEMIAKEQLTTLSSEQEFKQKTRVNKSKS